MVKKEIEIKALNWIALWLFIIAINTCSWDANRVTIVDPIKVEAVQR